jgi:hypothetical protein
VLHTNRKSKVVFIWFVSLLLIISSHFSSNFNWGEISSIGKLNDLKSQDYAKWFMFHIKCINSHHNVAFIRLLHTCQTA